MASQAGINGFAGGALLVTPIDSMIPEVKERARDYAGPATVVGFALAAGSRSSDEKFAGGPMSAPHASGQYW